MSLWIVGFLVVPSIRLGATAMAAAEATAMKRKDKCRRRRHLPNILNFLLLSPL